MGLLGYCLNLELLDLGWLNFDFQAKSWKYFKPLNHGSDL
jgi:hypothetical protein